MSIHATGHAYARGSEHDDPVVLAAHAVDRRFEVAERMAARKVGR
jgi:hypothetical protein